MVVSSSFNGFNTKEIVVNVNVNGCTKNLYVNDFKGISIRPVISKIVEHFILYVVLANISFRQTINLVLRRLWGALMLFML